MEKKKRRVKIDGSVLEGGGQILRLSTSLSCLLSVPLEITKIRKNRKGRDGKPKTGLRNQHLVGIKFIGKLCGADITGAKLHSEDVEFTPQKKCCVNDKNVIIDAFTAGAIGLLVQISFPCLIFAERNKFKEISCIYKGGTNVDFSPNFEYLQEIFFPTMKHLFKLDCVELLLHRRCSGNTRYGNGKVELKIKDKVDGLNGFTLTDKGKLEKIKLIGIVAGKVPVKVAEDLVKAAERGVNREFKDVEIEKVVLEDKSQCNFCQVMIVGETSTGCRFGNFEKKGRKQKPKKVINNLVNCFVQNDKEGGCCDEYLQDQLVIFMALAKGESKLRIGKMTLHTQTAIHFAEKITKVDFKVEEQDDGTTILSCTGIGYTN